MYMHLNLNMKGMVHGMILYTGNDMWRFTKMKKNLANSFIQRERDHANKSLKYFYQLEELI